MVLSLLNCNLKGRHPERFLDLTQMFHQPEGRVESERTFTARKLVLRGLISDMALARILVKRVPLALSS